MPRAYSTWQTAARTWRFCCCPLPHPSRGRPIRGARGWRIECAALRERERHEEGGVREQVSKGGGRKVGKRWHCPACVVRLRGKECAGRPSPRQGSRLSQALPGFRLLFLELECEVEAHLFPTAHPKDSAPITAAAVSWSPSLAVESQNLPSLTASSVSAISLSLSIILPGNLGLCSSKQPGCLLE